MTQITLAEERTKLAFKNRWRTIYNNPKIVVIALFASFGGFEYGYQQGVLGQSLVMTRFKDNFPSVVASSSATGWLTSVLQLGGIIGSLSAGVLGEVFSRKYTMFSACCWVILGSYLYCGATYHNPAMLYAGRFFTGVGVGTFSGVGPLYNAELSAPEMRGFLVSFYQFCTILGIMLSFWIGYASNYIGGYGDEQSDLAWRLPSIIQGIPAVLLAFGIWWLPFSPRWLVKQGRDQEALSTLAYLRKLPEDHELVQVEYMEIKAECLFEQRAFAKTFPNLAAKEKGNVWVREFAQYYNIVRTWDNFKRVSTAWLVMFWQQWSGIDAIIYYASNIFQTLGLTGGTQAMLATGVTGVVFLVSTLPAMAVIDKVGRKPMLMVGSLVMLVSMIIAAVIVGKFSHDWTTHAGAGWVAVAFIWIYVGAFGATWGPVSWTLVAEIFPLSIRSKGSSIGASSNWVNNFAVAFYVPAMLKSFKHFTYVFFACFLAASIVWIYFFLPETKGVTLEEMDRVFGSRTGEEDAILLEEARRDVGLSMEQEIDAVKAEKKLMQEIEEHDSSAQSHHEDVEPGSKPLFETPSQQSRSYTDCISNHHITSYCNPPSAIKFLHIHLQISKYLSDVAMSPEKPPSKFGHLPLSTSGPIDCALTGTAILNTPYLNKGSAFLPQERRDFDLTGLLPQGLQTLDQQVKRAYQQYSTRDGDLAKNTFLTSLKGQNEVLYYKLLQDHLKEMMSVVYTPTEGDAIQNYSRLFRRPEGCYLNIHDQGRVEHDLAQWGKPEDIDYIVVTDGEEILGIGDQGVGGILISSAKLVLTTLCAGIHPNRTLPVVLDCGTDNEELLGDDLYLGLREKRVRGKTYDDFVDTFVKAARKLYPKAYLHFEDFGLPNARRLLDLYRPTCACFNDDVEGTGCVTLAAIMAGLHVSKQKLSDVRMVVFGAGSAGVGIADQVRDAIATEGNISHEDAAKQIWLIDKPGLLTTDTEVSGAQKAFAKDGSEWKDKDTDLLAVINAIRPNILIGTSTVPGSFTEAIVKAMAAHTSRPIILPLSNPTRLHEAKQAAAKAAAGNTEDLATDNYGPVKPTTRVDAERTKVRDIGEAHLGKTVRIRAWIQNSRMQGAKMVFVELRQDRDWAIQGVVAASPEGTPVSKQMVKWIGAVNLESYVLIEARVEKPLEPVKSVRVSDFELHITKCYCISPAPEMLGMGLAVANKAVNNFDDEEASTEVEEAKQGVEGLSIDSVPSASMATHLNNPAMHKRAPVQQAIADVRMTTRKLFSEFCDSHGFNQFEPPCLIGAASEGGSNVFGLPYFEKQAFLAQSPQFYKQYELIGGRERVYSIGPVFRAENANTPRHMTEFTGLDLEMEIEDDYHEVLDMLVNALLYIFRGLKERCAYQIALVRTVYPSEEFLLPEEGKDVLRLTFAEGQALLRAEGPEEYRNVSDDEDMSTPQEKALGALIKKKYNTDFYVLDKFPEGARPFYALEDPENPKVTNAYDFFMRGQEILSGAQRIHLPDVLEARLRKKGIDPTSQGIKEYVDIFRSAGAPPHGGGGIGLDRVVAWYLALPSVHLASYYPRTPKRLLP
ncbi:hypothetical protein G7046_g6568 [Stylonectria norvegica]|nr:hypothetical protein G7046_g6568 [Stylonectria norvegica]